MTQMNVMLNLEMLILHALVTHARLSENSTKNNDNDDDNNDDRTRRRTLLQQTNNENDDVSGDALLEVLNNINSKIMRSQWDRLKFTQKIDGTVPFLPLEEEHIRQVLEYKLQKVRDQGIVKKKWKNIEWTNEFLESKNVRK